MADDRSEEIRPDELREFMEGDWAPLQADPAFVQRLRGKLWELLQTKLAGSGRVRGRSRAKPASADAPPTPPAKPLR